MRKAYEKSAKTVATAASALIEARAGAGTGGFLMLPEEAQDIAEPASRLLARHMPAAGGAGRITDVGDLVELVVAGFGYLMNGLGRRAAVVASWSDGAVPVAFPPDPSPAARQPEPTSMPGLLPAPPRPPTVGAGVR